MDKLTTICFGGEDWWYHNRGHVDMQLMRRFVLRGSVVYVNSIVMQKPSFKRNTGGGASLYQKVCRKGKSILRGLRHVAPGFWVYSPVSLPLHDKSWGRVLNRRLLETQISLVMRNLEFSDPLVWVACPAACDVALHMKNSKLIYQRTDCFEEYPNVDKETIKAYDQRLKQAADLTIYVSRPLFEKEGHQCRSAIYLDHGVDFARFKDADGQCPADMRGIKRPIVGFFGGIDNHTMDVPFLERVVEMTPDFSFVLVGRASADVTKLSSFPNVYMLGQKEYQQIPQYGRNFDVCIMPWQQNEWIKACNPIKLKEYLALGKPVVSTPFPELQKYSDFVYQALDAAEFSRKIALAIEEDSWEQAIIRQKAVENDTWEAKAQHVIDTIFAEAATVRV